VSDDPNSPKHLVDLAERLTNEVASLRAENARLREALRRYGWHTDECLDKCAHTRSGNCACGFDSALEAKT
jgi:hypothetical protein